MLERGEQAFYEGFAREAAIPLDGPFGTIINQLRLLRESGLYDVVAADLTRPNRALSTGAQSPSAGPVTVASPQVTVPVTVAGVTVSGAGLSNDPRRRIREIEGRVNRSVRWR